jgi:hypothetical protein
MLRILKRHQVKTVQLVEATHPGKSILKGFYSEIITISLFMLEVSIRHQDQQKGHTAYGWETGGKLMALVPTQDELLTLQCSLLRFPSRCKK